MEAVEGGQEVIATEEEEGEVEEVTAAEEVEEVEEVETAVEGAGQEATVVVEGEGVVEKVVAEAEVAETEREKKSNITNCTCLHNKNKYILYCLITRLLVLTSHHHSFSTVRLMRDCTV